jgi:hypothetical protein
MKSNLTKLFLIVFSVIIFSLAPEAKADQVVLTGSLTSAFDSAGFSSTSVLGPLTFTSASNFSLAERPDYLSQPPVSILGYLSLNGPLSDIPGGQRTLNLRFVFDGDVNPNPLIMSGALEVYPDTNGVNIYYFSSQHMAFTSNGVTGQFVLLVNFDFLRVGGTVPLYGSIFVTQRNPPLPTPEPATITLLGMGLAGVGALVRKRYKSSGKV